MSNPNMPPVRPFPTLQPWRTNNFSQGNIGRDALPSNAPVGNPGFDLPPDVVPTFDPESAVTLNGSKNYPVGTTSTKIIDSPSGATARRSLLMMRNTSAAAIVYVEFGTEATTLSVVRLAPNEVFMWDVRVPNDDIYVVGDVAGTISASWGVSNPPKPKL